MKIQFGKTKREEALLSILAIVLIVVIYFQIFFKPAIMKLSKLLPDVSMLKADLMSAKSLIENRDLIKKENENLHHKIDDYGEIFPSQQEIPRLLENLSSIAGQSGVKIVGIKPVSKQEEPVEEEGHIYKEIPIEISARSGYHQLGRFLQDLEMGERFIMVKDIEISADPENKERHNVHLIASTYVLLKEW